MALNFKNISRKLTEVFDYSPKPSGRPAPRVPAPNAFRAPAPLGISRTAPMPGSFMARQPVRPAVQRVDPRSLPSRIIDTLNPLDGARTWSRPQPMNQRSAFRQLTNSSPVNTVQALPGGLVQSVKAAPIGTAIRVAAANRSNNPVARANAIAENKAQMTENFKAENIAMNTAGVGGLRNVAANAVKAKAAKPTVVPKTKPAPKAKRPQLDDDVASKTDYLLRYIPENGRVIQPKNIVSRKASQVGEAYRTKVDAARDKVNDKLMAGIASNNPLVSKVANSPTVIWNRFGQKDDVRRVLPARDGQQENVGKVISHITDDIGTKLSKEANPQKSLERIDRFFESPDWLKRSYGNGRKIGYKNLTKTEREVVDQMVEINKMRNDTLYKMGRIDAKLHRKYLNGKHSPRIFDLDDAGKVSKARSTSLMDTKATKKRVELKDISDEVFESRERNPVMRMMIRAEQAFRDEATFDAMAKLQKAGMIRDKAPKNNKNFSQLSGEKYGAYNGKYILNTTRTELDRAIKYNTDMGKNIGGLIEGYQNTKLGAADRFFKSTKTTLNPGTFFGNVVSNPVAFNSAAGVNPLTQSKNMVKAAANLSKDAKRNTIDRNIYEARKQGIAVNDTGKQLTGDRRSGKLTLDSKRTKNPVKIAGNIYGGADKAAQLALYEELIARGLSPARAARRVAQGTQDYGNAGRLVQNLADSPILGKPFARFTPELTRLVKNNLVYNPVGTGLKAGGFIYGADKLSEMSGETEQERQARENAVGQTQLPFTNQLNKAITGRDANLSLNVPVGDTSVNLARISGLNYPMEPNSDQNDKNAAKKALVNQALPFAIPTRKDAQGNTVFAPNEIVSSLAFRPLADQWANRDFMGRTISDPQNRTQIEGVGEKGKQKSGAPSSENQRNDRLRSLGASYVPGFNEANALLAAKDGRKDYYGKERTVTQAALRAVGIKTESNDKKAREKRVSNNEFFNTEQRQKNDFLNKNPDLKEAYATVTSKTVDRKNTKTNDIIDPEKWKVIASDKSNRLYNQLKKEAEYNNKTNKDKNGNGQPVNPLFKLSSPERIKEVLELRSRPTGDDIEREEILRATTTWYEKFEKDERQYYKDNDNWFKNLPKREGSSPPPKTNPRVKAYGDIKYPEQAPIVKKYYDIKAKDPAAAKAFYKANQGSLTAAFNGNKQARLDYINAKRAIEGATPLEMDVFDNVTFGFEADEDKVATQLYFKGKGGGSGFSNKVGSKKKGSSSNYIAEDDPNGYYSNPYKTNIRTGSRRLKSVVKPRAQSVRLASARPAKKRVTMKIKKSRA